MGESLSKTGADRFEVRVTADSHFGWVRTRLSLERTMMSWLRTATALIGFGFALVQYLNHLEQFPGARSSHFNLAVLVDASLPLGRIIRPDCRHETGRDAIASSGGWCPSHLDRPVRLFRRTIASLLAAQAERLRLTRTSEASRPIRRD
jgi:Domain of unknown function (DUF202)